MKKKKLNAADIILILVIVLAAAGIVIRIFGLPTVPFVSDKDYRAAFTAELDGEQLEKVNAGMVFKDSSGTEVRLLEGYWIKNGADSDTINGEFLINGRLTEEGFECDGRYYHKNDVITLTCKDLSISVTLVDFLEKR